MMWALVSLPFWIAGIACAIPAASAMIYGALYRQEIPDDEFAVTFLTAIIMLVAGGALMWLGAILATL